MDVGLERQIQFKEERKESINSERQRILKVRRMGSGGKLPWIKPPVPQFIHQLYSNTTKTALGCCEAK